MVLGERIVVQPDLFIVCDKAKVTPKSIQGSPDVVIEIVSRATAFKYAHLAGQDLRDAVNTVPLGTVA